MESLHTVIKRQGVLLVPYQLYDRTNCSGKITSHQWWHLGNLGSKPGSKCTIETIQSHLFFVVHTDISRNSLRIEKRKEINGGTIVWHDSIDTENQRAGQEPRHRQQQSELHCHILKASSVKEYCSTSESKIMQIFSSICSLLLFGPSRA